LIDNKINEIVSFVRATFDKPKEFIPLHEPRFRGNEKKYLNDCIDSTFVSSVGEYVNRFEDLMCSITGSKYAIATTNGTSALHIAILLADVLPGDEVLTQSLSFVATCNAINYAGAKAHFVDVDKDSLSLSPTILKEHLASVAEMKDGFCFNRKNGNRIKACIPMHTFGMPARINEIKEICDEYNITLIEDAAESLGSYNNKQHTGTVGLIGTFSFNGNKIVTCGGGGALVTNDKDLALKAKHLTTTAKVNHPWEYIHDEVGFNYRMPNINAALMNAQLEQLEGFLKNKRELAEKYIAFFKNLEIKFISEREGTTSNYWLNAIQLESREERDSFLKQTNEKGIMTRPLWRPLNELVMYSDSFSSDLTNANYLADRVINIPSSVR
jgi:aminotransferase in exopolysaccharide biosynthesis